MQEAMGPTADAPGIVMLDGPQMAEQPWRTTARCFGQAQKTMSLWMQNKIVS